MTRAVPGCREGHDRLGVVVLEILLTACKLIGSVLTVRKSHVQQRQKNRQPGAACWNVFDHPCVKQGRSCHGP